MIFPHPPSDAPVLTLVVGQPGAGVARASSHFIGDDLPAKLSAGDLRTFHPQHLDQSRSPEGLSPLTEATTEWMRSALNYARTTRRSLSLDGTRSTLDLALATTNLFGKSGFETTVVVVAVPRTESLLATASKFLLDSRSGRPSTFTSIAEHDASFEAARALVHTLESAPTVDRLTILGRDGVSRFDSLRTDAAAFGGATAALDRERATALPSPQAMRWLSELRAMTDYAMSSRQVERPLADVLIELHEIGIREVLPRLPLPKDSQARPAAEASLGRQLVAIRQAVPVTRRVQPQPGPVVSMPEPDRGISL
nr:zeta toxin family protein [Microbacterium sp. 2FI]